MITHNGKNLLASGSDRGCSTIVLWDLSTYTIRLRLTGHTGAVTSIVDLQDNRSLISGSYDKTLNVYSLNEGKILYNLPVNKTQVTNILLNSNGSKMVSCGLDNSLSVWKIVRNASHIVETIFLERIIENNTLISAIVASVVTPELVYLGAKDGKIKLINIDQGDAYKIYNVCNNAVVEIAAVERQNKSGICYAIQSTPSSSSGPATKRTRE
jgi:WD40 repeat protein